MAEYALDIAAAHALLGAAAASAQLVAVNVPTSYGHWVEPGVCYNGIGYWEVPNARVVYRQGGASLVRHRLDDLLARRAVRGAPGRGAALRQRRSGRRSGSRSRHVGLFRYLLAEPYSSGVVYAPLRPPSTRNVDAVT